MGVGMAFDSRADRGLSRVRTGSPRTSADDARTRASVHRPAASVSDGGPGALTIVASTPEGAAVIAVAWVMPSLSRERDIQRASAGCSHTATARAASVRDGMSMAGAAVRTRSIPYARRVYSVRVVT